MNTAENLKTFSSHISSLLAGLHHDAILLVEGEEVPVHKAILAARSKFFKRTFSPNVGNQRGAASTSQTLIELRDVYKFNNLPQTKSKDTNGGNVFELQNVPLISLRRVLNFIYSGVYTFHPEVKNDCLALELAHQFSLEDLQDLISDHLVMIVTMENFFHIYNLESHYKSRKLNTACIHILENKGPAIAKSANFHQLTLDSLLSLLELDSFAALEIDIFHAVEGWVRHNKPTKEQAAEIVKRIRLATIPQKKLFTEVEVSKAIPSISIIEALRSISKKDEAATNFRHPPYEEVADVNVAQFSMGSKLLRGIVEKGNLISGFSGCTSHIHIRGNSDCIIMQLGKIYRLNFISFSLDVTGGRSFEYHIESSVIEGTWKRIIDHTDYWCRSHQFLRFAPRPVRFIKITGVDYEKLKINSLKATYTNTECEIIQKIQVASSNVALENRGATVTGGKNPMNCISWDKSTYALVYVNNHITLSLGQPYWLSSLRILLFLYGDGYTVETSDGKQWQPVGGETEGDYGYVCQDLQFSSRVVLYFRIKMKKIKYKYIYVYQFESPSSNIAVTN